MGELMKASSLEIPVQIADRSTEKNLFPPSDMTESCLCNQYAYILCDMRKAQTTGVACL